jgi:hypothetical protein
MDTATEQPTRPPLHRPLKLAAAMIWKTPALIVALVIGLIAANSVGWNGGAWLLGRGADSEGFDGFINHLIMVVSSVGCAAVLYFVARIAKWALWGFVPLMVYAALVLGTWDGVASGFDATRVEAIRHHYANAYALQHMRPSAVDATCHDPRITIDSDAHAICASHEG